MNNLQASGLVKLDKIEMKSIGGGLVIASFKAMLDAYNWCYTEFKKGVDDGYNNR